MFTGYLEVGGAEILNRRRAYRYMTDGECPAGWLKLPSCEPSEAALEDETYQGGPSAGAPWYDPQIEATGRFFGAYPLGITGISDSTRVASIAEGILDGGVVQGGRHAVRQVRARAMLIGRGEDALEAGMSWLQAALEPSECSMHGGMCGSADVCFFAACPPVRGTFQDYTDWQEVRRNFVRDPRTTSLDTFRFGPANSGNVILFPDAEDGTTDGWEAYGDATVINTDWTSYRGDRSYRVDASTIGAGGMRAIVGGSTPGVASTGLTIESVGARVSAPVGTEVVVSLEEVTPDGATVVGPLGETTAVATGDWDHISVIGDAKSSGANVARVSVSPGAAQDIFFTDFEDGVNPFGSVEGVRPWTVAEAAFAHSGTHVYYTGNGSTGHGNAYDSTRTFTRDESVEAWVYLGTPESLSLGGLTIVNADNPAQFWSVVIDPRNTGSGTNSSGFHIRWVNGGSVGGIFLAEDPQHDTWYRVRAWLNAAGEPTAQLFNAAGDFLGETVRPVADNTFTNAHFGVYGFGDVYYDDYRVIPKTSSIHVDDFMQVSGTAVPEIVDYSDEGTGTGTALRLHGNGSEAIVGMVVGDDLPSSTDVRVSMRTRATITQEPVYILVYRDLSDSTSAGVAQTVIPAGESVVSVVMSVPAGVMTANAGVKVLTAPNFGTLDITDVLVEETPGGDYFDGSMDDSETVDYEWVGGVNQSASTMSTRTLETFPEPEDEYLAEVETYLRHLHGAQVISGPLILEQYRRDDLYAYEVEFTLATAPHVFTSTADPNIIQSDQTVIVDTARNFIPNPSAELTTGTRVVARNLIVNPSVETNLTGWTLRATESSGDSVDPYITTGRSTFLAAHGTYSAILRIVGDGSTTAEGTAVMAVKPPPQFTSVAIGVDVSGLPTGYPVTFAGWGALFWVSGERVLIADNVGNTFFMSTEWITTDNGGNPGNLQFGEMQFGADTTDGYSWSVTRPKPAEAEMATMWFGAQVGWRSSSNPDLNSDIRMYVDGVGIIIPE